MHKLILSTLSISMCLAANAQQINICNIYNEAMRNGKIALNKKDYQGAITQFLTAQQASLNCESSNKKDPANNLNKIYNEINKQKDDAIKAKDDIDILFKEVKAQKKIADSALAKAEKFINALNLKEGGLALAYNNEGRVGYIDINGDPRIPYLYRTAGAFDATGFAKVQRIEEFAIPNTMPQRTEYRPVDYIINDTGQQYRSAYRLDDLKTVEEQKDEIHTETIEALDLRNTLLNSFPPKILDQQSLQILIIEPPLKFENTINKIPKEIQNFKNLSYLSVKKSNIDSLPDEIGQLKELQYLNLRDNKLKNIPASIGQLKDLKFLDLKNNSLSSLPEELGLLKNLESLYLYNNQLTKLPASFGELTSLKRLTFGNTPLPELPSIVDKFTSLQELWMSDMSFNYFPPQVLKLNKLKILNLSENLINILPVGLSKLTELKELDLHSCGLKELQSDFEKLQNLKELNLSGNEFEHFPIQITQLINLETLDFSYNRNFKKTIPKEIRKLQNLKSLIINNSNISVTDQKMIKESLPNCKIIFMRETN